jgi:hypothetical protein
MKPAGFDVGLRHSARAVPSFVPGPGRMGQENGYGKSAKRLIMKITEET